MPANRYGTAVTRQQLDANTLEIVEDITFNNARVGGARVVFDFLVPNAQKLAGFTVGATTATATLLDQSIDLTYGGAVFMRLRVTAVPDATLPAGHSISIETTAVDPVNQPPISLVTQILV